ncbi:MAG: aspartate kinase [Saprospiraceae bacterium]|nr:aspartate kinase [Saprospiraceae bacterium]
MEVFKFGGASVKDEEGIRNLARIVQTQRSKDIVLVVSAMGKTTNALEQVADAFYQGKADAQEKLRNLKSEHLKVAAQLDLSSLIEQGVLNDLFVEAEWLIEDEVHDSYDYIYDQIVAIGELLSTRVVEAYLRCIGLPSVWIDARDVIKTDDNYRSAELDWEKTSEKVDQIVRPVLEEGQIAVIAGFIGSTPENNTITLGREGSDYTAAILAAILKAESLSVWKDVPGIMTADPHLFDDAKLMPEIDYREAIEMTYYGARVIHPKTIKPLMDQQIPLLVRSFAQPEINGTVVHTFSHIKYPPVKVLLSNQTLLQLYTRDFTFVIEDHFSEVFRLAVAHKIRIHMLENLALNLSLVIQSDLSHVQPFVDALQASFDVVRTDGLDLCTIRHFETAVVNSLKLNRKVYIEEYNATTAQLVLG